MEKVATRALYNVHYSYFGHICIVLNWLNFSQSVVERLV